MFFPSNTCYHALIFDDEDEYIEYIAIATTQIEEHPENYAALNNRGVAYSELGNTEDALADFKAACALAPEDSIPHLNLATLLEDAGELEGALAEITRAIQLSPTNSSYYMVRASIHERMGNHTAYETDHQTGLQYRTA